MSRPTGEERRTGAEGGVCFINPIDVTQLWIRLSRVVEHRVVSDSFSTIACDKKCLAPVVYGTWLFQINTGGIIVDSG